VGLELDCIGARVSDRIDVGVSAAQTAVVRLGNLGDDQTRGTPADRAPADLKSL